MSKVKEKTGICTICGEPAAMNQLTQDGLCPDCEGARLDVIFHNITGDGKTISAAKRNNAQADMMKRMFAHFI